MSYIQFLVGICKKCKNKMSYDIHNQWTHKCIDGEKVNDEKIMENIHKVY